jgi:putative transposase
VKVKEFINRQKVEGKYPVEKICRALGVSRSSVYKAENKESAGSIAKKKQMATKVKEAFYFHSRRYGARRLSDELKDAGDRIGRRGVTALMKQQNLRAIQAKQFRP